MADHVDPFTLAQAWGFMGSATIFTHNITRGKHYLRRCIELVKMNDIRFVPHLTGDEEDVTSAPRLDFTEEVHERAVFLAQLIYWLTYMNLLDGHSEEHCADLEHQFRFELPVRFA